jgi:hypothetical protein
MRLPIGGFAVDGFLLVDGFLVAEGIDCVARFAQQASSLWE